MKWIAKITLYLAAYGGRVNPVYDGYRPNITRYGRNSDCVIHPSKEKIYPGNSYECIIDIIHPEMLEHSDKQAGSNFDIREGHKIVGNLTLIKTANAK